MDEMACKNDAEEMTMSRTEQRLDNFGFEDVLVVVSVCQLAYKGMS
jgi:hypothetical protein